MLSRRIWRIAVPLCGAVLLIAAENLLAHAAAPKGVPELSKEVSRLEGVPVLQVMQRGMTTRGQPLPAASEGPLPASSGPSMSAARDVAQQTAKVVYMSA